MLCTSVIVLLLLGTASVISADDLVAVEDNAPGTTTPATTITTTSKSPPPPPSIKSLHVNTNIAYRYARTLITSRVINPASDVSQEIKFSVILPETAFISGFLMEIGGKVYTAYVKEKEEAKKIYDDAVSSGQTAAHVALSARDSNRFTVSLNVEPQQKVTFNLTYEELLTRTSGLYKHTMNLDPGQIVDDLSVKVNITESNPIYRVEVPSLRENNELVPVSSENATQDSYARIVRENPKSALIYWAPSTEDQKSLRAEGIKGQLEVMYDVEREQKGDILVNDGYFVHFYSPKDLPPLPKHVVFVLDVSGSMNGQKISQLREAMDLILGDLHDKDYFSIVLFHSTISIWNPNAPGQQDIEGINPDSILRANSENIGKAKDFVKNLRALYSTNIDDALRRGLEIAELGSTETIKGRTGSPPERMMVFLTDGQPNQGESDPDKIISNVAKQTNTSSDKTVIFSLGFGNDADMTFLRKLSLNNTGFAKKIYEAADATLQLRDFYSQISSPLLADVTFKYQPENVKTKTVTKHKFRTFFLGSEIVVAGQLDATTTNSVSGSLVARGAEGKTISETLPKPLSMDCIEWPYPIVVRENAEPGIAERVWAYLTIQQLLDEDKAGNSDSKKKALELALKYSFVTPVTSLVVVKPNETKSIEAEDASAINRPSYDTSNYALLSAPMVPLSGGVLGFGSFPPPSAGFFPVFSRGPVLGSIKNIVRHGVPILQSSLLNHKITGDSFPSPIGRRGRMRASPRGRMRASPRRKRSKAGRSWRYPSSAGYGGASGLSFPAGQPMPMPVEPESLVVEDDLNTEYEKIEETTVTNEEVTEYESQAPTYFTTTFNPSTTPHIASSTVPPTPQSTTPGKDIIVPLDDIVWLKDETKANATHVNINSQYYLLRTSEANTPFDSCTIAELPQQEAHCRYFQYCSLKVYNNWETFKQRFCAINGHAGVCCPDNIF